MTAAYYGEIFRSRLRCYLGMKHGYGASMIVWCEMSEMLGGGPVLCCSGRDA